MKRIAFVTHGAATGLAADDVLAAVELERRGAIVEGVAWDDAAARWEQYDVVVIRSTWDYHLRMAEFTEWLDHLGRVGARVWNPPALLRWNADKHYLRELAAAGVRTVPTRWVRRGSAAGLDEILREEGWSSAVVKPVVSASAHGTWRTEQSSSASDAARFRETVARTAAMVQPFLESIEQGEWSLCYIMGTYSHAVLKVPAPGDFRVQVEHQGRVLRGEPPLVARRAADAALAVLPAPTLYARVDGCLVNGEFVLLELELLEPVLFFGWADGSAARFAAAVLASTTGSSIVPAVLRAVDGSA